MAKGELFAFGTAAAALGGAYKLSEFLYKAKRLRDVGPSNAVYVRIIGRVRSDLDEVRRLLSVREVHDALEANPDKSKWVYGVMRDVRGALENITPHTERVGSDIEDGRRIGVRHRVYWLLSEKEKLENREKELAIAHASLTEVLGFLTGLEPIDAPKSKHKPDETAKETHIDIDIRREAPAKHTEHVEREVWVERDGPRRVEERDVWIERDGRGPPRYEEHRDVYVDERAPRPVEDRGDQYQRDLDFERYDPADPRYQQQSAERFEQHDTYERRGAPPDDRRYQPAPLGRRPESFEDRVPERDSWMQSANRAYGAYGAPQYQRRFQGDAGFGDQEVLNPQPVPPPQQYAPEREVSHHQHHHQHLHPRSKM